MSADIIIKAPVEDLLVSSFRPNRKYKLVGPGGVGLGESARPYGANDKYLVRTALVRADNFGRGKPPKINDPRAVADLCRHLVDMDQEFLVTISVDVTTRLMAIHETAIGGRSSASANVLDILKVSVLCGAAGVLIVHNHPSGSPIPSDEDFKLRDGVQHSLACVGLQLLDSIIVAREEFYSMGMDQILQWNEPRRRSEKILVE